MSERAGWRQLMHMPRWRSRGAAVHGGATAGQLDACLADAPGFLAALHPLEREFLAYRHAAAGGQPHSLDETAEHFGIDPAFARLVDEYLAIRRRLHLEQAGWRAGQMIGW